MSSLLRTLGRGVSAMTLDTTGTCRAAVGYRVS
jgi:hypothetical protein